MSGYEGKLAIIGWPVSHSRSPLIHNHWLAAQGAPALYEAYPIDPKDDFRAALAAMAAAGYRGANVTVPHKQAAFAAMDELSTTAESLGAVNTISFKNDRLHGDNTDGDGFMASLDAAADDGSNKQNGQNWRGHPALVLGAGGAARAIVAALGRAGVADIRLVNRSRDKAEGLTGLAENLHVDDWPVAASMAAGCGLLVNTTSLGMVGQPPLRCRKRAARLTPECAGLRYCLCAVGDAALACRQGGGYCGGRARHADASSGAVICGGTRPAIEATLRDSLSPIWRRRPNHYVSYRTDRLYRHGKIGDGTIIHRSRGAGL